MAAPDDTELAFAENLILLGAVTGPRLLPVLALRDRDPRPLWEHVERLELATPEALEHARSSAAALVQAVGGQSFSFSEGAMVGPWELLERRGRTVGGEVWLGSRDGVRGTLRVVPPGSGHDPERTRRFVERSNVGLPPPGPAILRIDEADEDFGWLYTATAGVEARPLAALVEQGPLPEAAALAIGVALAQALEVAHGFGVIHGGLGPLAVLFVGQEALISDFGVGSAILDGPAHGTRPGSRLGALLYASPGLIQGGAERGLLADDDLFALGAILYRVVCDPSAPLTPSAGAPWSSEPPVSAGLRTVLARLLDPRPNTGYPSATILRADLERVAAGGAPEPLPARLEPPVSARRYPSAQPQELLSPAALRAAIAPRPAPRPAATPVAAAVVDEPQTRKAIEAPTARHRGLPSGRQARKGSGWVVFAATTVLVAGGLGLAHLLTQPEGVDAGRARLAEAGALLSAERPKYSDARARLREALPQLGPPQLRAAIGLWDTADALVRAERRRLLGWGAAPTAAAPEGAPVDGAPADGAPADGVPADGAPTDGAPTDGAPADAAPAGGAPASGAPAGGDGPPLDDRAPSDEALDRARDALYELLLRSEDLPAASLLRHDLLRRDDTADLRQWTDLGQELLAAGWPVLAADAFARAGRKPEQALAERMAAEMVFVRGGPYARPTGEALELVERSAAYLGRREVTRAEYARFLEAKAAAEQPHAGCDPGEPAGKDHRPEGWEPPTPDQGQLPVAGLDRWDALSYARWRGATLPDADALSAAAHGPEGLRFPWGDAQPGLPFANVGDDLRGPTPAGCLPGGAAACGALDLVGNVAEWLAPVAGQDEGAVFGGHHETPAAAYTDGAALLEPLPEDARRGTVGFRVLRPLDTP